MFPFSDEVCEQISEAIDMIGIKRNVGKIDTLAERDRARDENQLNDIRFSPKNTKSVFR